jgi:mannose-1-phosphate guanylyltransferase
MRYAMIMAGGSGTRLWPMSRKQRPKQLLPLIGGKSLLQIAVDRLAGLIPDERIYICAGDMHRAAILSEVRGAAGDRYLGEPVGRDTLNAVGFAAAALVRQDPDAVIAVFTADHLIEPVERFGAVVDRGYRIAESHPGPGALVTFGIRPTHAATGYGYLELGEQVDGAFVVDQFKEKPDAATAQRYVDAGPDKYLWNSGMFVWKAATLLRCIEKFAPENFAGLTRIGEAFNTNDRDKVITEVYPTLPKISVDFAVMEPASKDDAVAVIAVPMDLTWLDVGSWPAFAQTCEKDAAGNAVAAPRSIALDSRNNVIATGDADHTIALLGCDDLIVIHTPDATLICPRNRAEDIKRLHDQLGDHLR